jgi:ABC-type transport system substrate-binding protein
MPQISEDGLVYTVKIKEGVYFQDDACFPGGKARQLRAQNFVYAFKRIANIKTLSPNWAVLNERIVGLDEFREYTKSCAGTGDVDYSREVEGLQAPDGQTLVIKLTKPWPQVIYSALADTAYAPVAMEAVDYYGQDIISHPVGTGPFKLNVWRRGSYVELVRNPTFRGELYPSEGESGDAEAGYLDDAGKPIPFADRVVWTVIEEYQPAWLLFLQGKVDAGVIPKDSFDEVITGGGELTPAMKQRGIHLKTSTDPSTYWLGFNMADGVLGKNKPLRRAISYAIDRERFIELFFNNRHLVAHGVIPPMMAGYNAEIEEKGYSRYDSAKAKELLAEAERIRDGKLPVLKIAMPGASTWFHQYGQFLQRSLAAIGLQAEVQYMDGPTFQGELSAGNVQMFASGATASIPDAQEFLSLFHSKHAGAGPNAFNYSNPQFDQLYESAAASRDGPERQKLYQEMELIVLEDCPAAFLNHRVAYVLHHDWYKNYKPHAFAYSLSKYRRIDMAKRAAYKELAKKIE